MSFVKKNIYLLSLVAFNLILYRRWLSFSIFANGDWHFYLPSALIANFPNAWDPIQGLFNFVLWRYPLDFAQFIFGLNGLSSNFAEKLVFFWPVILLPPISIFLLLKYITKSDLASFAGSVFFVYNSYFLSIDTVGHELLTIAFSISVFGLLSFISLLKSKNKFLIPVTSLFLLAVGFYDLRSLYLISGVIFLYFVFNQFFQETQWMENLKTNLSNLLGVFFSLFLMSLYWLLPTYLSQELVGNPILSRGILSSNFYNIQTSITTFFPFWTGSTTTWFFVQEVPFHFWLYPILAFAAIVVEKKNRIVLFFSTLALIGIFLSKQDGPPFGNLYALLYSHFPGFSAFRESSKFYFLVIISYAVLIAFFAQYLLSLSSKRIKYLLIILIVSISLWNGVPLLTGSIKTLFEPKYIPNNLEKVDQYFLKDQEFSRVLWINRDTHFRSYNKFHPEIDPSLIDNFIGGNPDNSQVSRLRDFLISEKGRNFLKAGSYGYIIINTASANIGLDSNVWKSLSKELNGQSYLRVDDLGLSGRIIFKNENFKPHIYATLDKENLSKYIRPLKLDFKEKGPEEYLITLESPGKLYLNFTENFDTNWRIYEGNLKWWKLILGSQNELRTEDLKNAAGFNSFYLDSNACSSYPCHITLFYKPQAYLYLGLVLSAIFFVGSVFFGIYTYRYRKERK